MKINLTIDNFLRNPLHWGVDKMPLAPLRVLGVKFETRSMVGHIEKGWVLSFWFWKKYRYFTNIHERDETY